MSFQLIVDHSSAGGEITRTLVKEFVHTLNMLGYKVALTIKKKTKHIYIHTHTYAYFLLSAIMDGCLNLCSLSCK